MEFRDDGPTEAGNPYSTAILAQGFFPGKKWKSGKGPKAVSYTHLSEAMRIRGICPGRTATRAGFVPVLDGLSGAFPAEAA